ncbi:MAG: deoxyribonuclease V [Rhodospirillales bacterium]
MPPAPPPDAAAAAWRRWDLTPKEAVAVQRQAAASVERADRFGPLRTVCGIDVAYGVRGRGGIARAAAVLLDLATLAVLAESVVQIPAAFPYVPGLLTFREAPAAIAAIEALPVRPDVLMCDGQGIAHPRRCGVASHLGLALDLPSVGAAKSRLCGTHADPPAEAGRWTPLLDGDEIIGACLRTKTLVRPLFISAGHRVRLATAVALVLQCTNRRRLPEPTRLADRLSKHPRRPPG